MRTSLLFLNLFCFILYVAAQDVSGNVDSGMVVRRAISMDMDKGHISGILLTKRDGDVIVGTVVNEFGITALSFVYSKVTGKIQLENIVGFLDKWYIKRVLKNDIKYAICYLYHLPIKTAKSYTVSEYDEIITIANNKRKITYTFSPIADETTK